MRSEIGCITELGTNHWRIRVSAGKDPITGKRIRLTKTIRGTRKDALRVQMKLQAETGDLSAAKETMTLSELITEVYLPSKYKQIEQGEFEPTSYETMHYDLTKYLLPSLGNLRLTQIKTYTIESWLSSIPQAPTRRKVYERWRTLWLQAAKWDLVDGSIVDKVNPPRKRKPKIVVAQPDTLMKIFEAVKDTRIEPLILMMGSCGLRASEACALNWDDIDFETEQVHIWRSFHSVDGFAPYFAKTKTERSAGYISIPSKIVERLVEIKANGDFDDNGALAPTRGKAGRFTPCYLSDNYRRLIYEKLPEQPYVPLKNLRHSHATILLEQGIDVALVSRRLRHTSINMTASTYLAPSRDSDENTSQVFNDAIIQASIKSH